MTIIEDTIEVRAPIEAVFDAIIDPRRGGEWNPAISDIRDVTDGPSRVGTEWKQTVHAAGREFNLSCRITQLDPPREGVLQVSGDQQGQVLTRCESSGNATRVIQTIDFALPGGMVGRLMGGVIQSGLRRELRESLHRLRDAMEREAGNAGGSQTA